MPTSRIEIIERIESLAGNMKQKELGEIIGCSQSKISELLSRTEKKRFSVEELERIADFFNVSVDYLLGRETVQEKPIEQITPRKFCEILVQMLDSPCPWEIREIIDEGCSAKAYSIFISNKTKTTKTAEYDFKKDTMTITSKPSENCNAININEFIGRVGNYHKLYESNDLDKEEYKTLVKNKFKETFLEFCDDEHIEIVSQPFSGSDPDDE